MKGVTVVVAVVQRMRLTVLLRSRSKLLDFYGRFHPSVLSIQQFIEFGKKNVSAKNSFVFLRKEIPVRLANILKEIQLLPEPLLNMPSVQLVERWYLKSFDDVLKFEKSDPDSDKTIHSFNDTLDCIQDRHKAVVETMAQGVMEMKAEASDMIPTIEGRIHYFLDRFYLSRISIRMLIHQHLLLYSDMDVQSRHVGCFDPSCDVLSVAKDAYDNARFLCEQYYSASPRADFHIHKPYDLDNKEEPSDSIVMTYVPSHLYYMLFELYKNALRAVVECHHGKVQLPNVQTLICKGREDVTVRISDQGGGVQRTDADKLFHYMYSTAPKPPSPDAILTTPLAGYGYGLPISRLYAKYFNGDLWLNTIDGFGTDAMVALKVFPKDASELLPVYNKTSSQRYAAAVQAKDWTGPVDGIHRGKMDSFKPSSSPP